MRAYLFQEGKIGRSQTFGEGMGAISDGSNIGTLHLEQVKKKKKKKKKAIR